MPFGGNGSQVVCEMRGGTAAILPVPSRYHIFIVGESGPLLQTYTRQISRNRRIFAAALGRPEPLGALLDAPLLRAELALADAEGLRRDFLVFVVTEPFD